MKIYIGTDMEGVSGIHRVEYVERGSDRYEEGRRLLTGDVNAAVEGALAAGAKEIHVCDGHGGGDHFLIEKIHPAAIVDHATGGRWWGELDESFDGLFWVGGHAMAGTPNAFLDHTQSSTSWYNYYLNGRKCGEIGQFACIAGHFGVPMLLVAGDRACCAEAADFFPGVTTVEVKYARARNTAVVMAPERAQQLIREGARKAIGLIGTVKPFVIEPPIEVKLELYRADYADGFAAHRGTERVDARCVRKVVDSALDILSL